MTPGPFELTWDLLGSKLEGSGNLKKLVPMVTDPWLACSKMLHFILIPDFLKFPIKRNFYISRTVRRRELKDPSFYAERAHFY